MNNIYYVYKHAIKETGEVFYIGRGKNRRAWDRGGRSQYWKNITSKYDYIVEIVKENIQIQESKDLEVELIAQFNPRANFTTGGDGTPGYKFDPDFVKERNQKNKKLYNNKKWVEKRTESLIKAMNRPQTKERVSKGLKKYHEKRRAEGKPFPGGKKNWSDEDRKKASEKQKGEKGYWYGKTTAIAKKIMNLDSGEIFPTIRAAAKSVGGNRISMSRSLKKGKETYKKQRFRYYEQK